MVRRAVNAVLREGIEIPPKLREVGHEPAIESGHGRPTLGVVARQATETRLVPEGPEEHAARGGEPTERDRLAGDHVPGLGLDRVDGAAQHEVVDGCPHVGLRDEQRVSHGQQELEPRVGLPQDLPPREPLADEQRPEPASFERPREDHRAFVRGDVVGVNRTGHERGAEGPAVLADPHPTRGRPGRVEPGHEEHVIDHADAGEPVGQGLIQQTRELPPVPARQNGCATLDEGVAGGRHVEPVAEHREVRQDGKARCRLARADEHAREQRLGCSAASAVGHQREDEGDGPAPTGVEHSALAPP